MNHANFIGTKSAILSDSHPMKVATRFCDNHGGGYSPTLVLGSRIKGSRRHGSYGPAQGRPGRPSIGVGRSLPRWRDVWACWSFFAGCGGGDGRLPVYPVTGKVTVSGECPRGLFVVLYPARPRETERRPSGKSPSRRLVSVLTTYDPTTGPRPAMYTPRRSWNKIHRRVGLRAGPTGSRRRRCARTRLRRSRSPMNRRSSRPGHHK